MALKEKILDRAQKYIQKGYLDKAITEYKAAVDIDPRDISIRLRVGDLYVKTGRKNEAIKEYTEVAKANSQRGFYLKAIAVYKQVLKLDDTNLEVHYKLAELYIKQRLIADAISEYSFIMSFFERKGKTSDVMDLLKKMADIDPENIGIRLKLADLYQKLSYDKDALAEYKWIFERLLSQGKIDKAEKIYLGLYNSNPGEPIVLQGLAELYKGKADAMQFLRFARPLLHLYKDNSEIEQAKAVAQSILEFRKDDVEALKFLGQFVARAEEIPALPAAEEPRKEQADFSVARSEPKITEIVEEAGAEAPGQWAGHEIEITLEGFEELEKTSLEASKVFKPEGGEPAEIRHEEAAGADVEVEFELPALEVPIETRDASERPTEEKREAQAAAPEAVELEIMTGPVPQGESAIPPESVEARPSDETPEETGDGTGPIFKPAETGAEALERPEPQEAVRRADVKEEVPLVAAESVDTRASGEIPEGAGLEAGAPQSEVSVETRDVPENAAQEKSEARAAASGAFAEEEIETEPEPEAGALSAESAGAEAEPSVFKPAEAGEDSPLISFESVEAKASEVILEELKAGAEPSQGPVEAKEEAQESEIEKALRELELKEAATESDAGQGPPPIPLESVEAGAAGAAVIKEEVQEAFKAGIEPPSELIDIKEETSGEQEVEKAVHDLELEQEAPPASAPGVKEEPPLIPFESVEAKAAEEAGAATGPTAVEPEPKEVGPLISTGTVETKEAGEKEIEAGIVSIPEPLEEMRYREEEPGQGPELIPLQAIDMPGKDREAGIPDIIVPEGDAQGISAAAQDIEKESERAEGGTIDVEAPGVLEGPGPAPQGPVMEEDEYLPEEVIEGGDEGIASPEGIDAPALKEAGAKERGPDRFSGLLEKAIEDYPVESEGGASEVEVSQEDLSEAISELMAKIEPEEMLIEPDKVRMDEGADEAKDEYVDLSAELGMKDALEDLSVPWNTVESRETLDDFKSGIGNQLSKEDTETHYNLGIAYMEMELYNEAAKEFKIALKDPRLEFDCFIRLGFCSMAGANPHEAIVYYLKGLKIEGKSDDERKGMMYELALAYEAAGSHEEAHHLFKAIHKNDPGFREVDVKVMELTAQRHLLPMIPTDDGLIEVEIL